MSIANQLRTVALLGLLTGIFLGIGYLIGGQGGMLIGLIFAGGMNFFSYWFSDKIVLAMYRAKEADRNVHPRLYTLVQEITQRAGLPMPKLYIVPNQHPNAFATGRNPKHAAVAVTTGILGLLNDHELKGVLAHELAHVKNRDILISSLAATIAGVISYVAMIARWGAIFGGFGGRGNDRNGALEFLVLAIVAPIMAMFIQLAISRSREYIADETGARFIKDATGLASALQKLEHGVAAAPLKPQGSTEATAHLFIKNPFKGKGLWSLFSTHPSTEDRVKKLQALRF